jgi:hypothetical protein
MRRPGLKNTIWTAVAYAGLMFASNLVTFLLTPLLAVYVLFMLLAGGLNLDLVRRAMPPAAVIALGLCLSGVFFLPLLLERQYIDVSQWTDGGGRYVYSSFFIDFFQLFSPHWGFGIAVPGPDDDLSYQLGLALVVLFALSFLIVPRVEDRSTRLTLRFMQGAVVVITFLMLPMSQPVWSVLPLAELAQFPWRLLVIVAPLLVVLAGTVVTRLAAQTQKEALLQTLPLVLLVMLASYPYLQANLRDPEPTEGPVSLASLFRFQQSANEMTGVTSWVKAIPTWSPLAETVINGGEITTRVIENTVYEGSTPVLGIDSFEMDSVHEFVWVYAADDQQQVSFYIPYHPGWTATLYEDLDPDNPDAYPYQRIGQPITTLEIETTDPEGWIVVPVPAGEHFLELRFKDTPIRVIGTALTFITLGLIMLTLIFAERLTRLASRFGSRMSHG